ncbi:MAG TPA: DUF6569 family protein [Terriglobia bacterium]|nr:DUF6569 family protein [Terriglobia bacterium]
MLRIARLIPPAFAVLLAVFGFQAAVPLPAGQTPSRYKALEPITEGNLTVFPVVAAETYDTSGFLTLDEGMRRSEVVITEAGRSGLIRPRPHQPHPELLVEHPNDGAEVNRLVLVNESNHPLILLAGEIVTGCKQDRVVARDRIVAPHSEPVDLSVFCVEPGRWTPHGRFISKGTPLAQPSVRREVMVDRNQESVWASVGRALSGAIAAAPAPAAPELRASSSYAHGMQNEAVQAKLRHFTTPIERDYGKLESQLRTEKAVGVVAAVNGQIIWADIFASPELFNQYWPKLVQSYAAEALTSAPCERRVGRKDAQGFLDEWSGRRTSAESETGVYRLAEASGFGFTAFTLTSLLPHTGFDVHDAKVADWIFEDIQR